MEEGKDGIFEAFYLHRKFFYTALWNTGLDSTKSFKIPTKWIPP
jgi:hypothetical protein